MSSESSNGPRLLIVDDDHGQRSLLETFLRAQGFRTQSAASGEAALQLLAEGTFAMMISDVRMPGMSGLEMLRRVRQTHPALPVLLVTAFADIRSAVTAMRDGAVNFLAKPIDLDELIASVRLATGPRSEMARPERAMPTPPSGVVTSSPLMQAVLRDAALIAPSESRVLITGESGVGKEVIADVIHAWSPRAAGPLVKVNCAAIPENLLESELFGHEKGSFTDAHQQRIGRFEEADGGTIFLDEIGDLPLQLQAKLLRIIQDGSFRRIGSARELRTDARVLAATNRDLEAQITDCGLIYRNLNPDLVVELTFTGGSQGPEFIFVDANPYSGVSYRTEAQMTILEGQGMALTRPVPLQLSQSGSPEGMVNQFRRLFEHRMPKLVAEALTELR